MKNTNNAEHEPKIKEQLDYAKDHYAEEEKNGSQSIISSRLMPAAILLTLFGVLWLFDKHDNIKKKKISQALTKLTLDRKNAGENKKDPTMKINKIIAEVGEMLSPGEITQRLSDVKGIDEITEEIYDVIDMLKNTASYKRKGANLPKGILLYGKPGTGKTLIARAMAGEANVAFFHYTGSMFDELFVGVGAKRVRNMFQAAQKHKPCIIFIDEIDTLLA